MAVFYEHGNEISVIIKCEIFLIIGEPTAFSRTLPDNIYSLVTASKNVPKIGLYINNLCIIFSASFILVHGHSST